jgi:hypothetical protein
MAIHRAIFLGACLTMIACSSSTEAQSATDAGSDGQSPFDGSAADSAVDAAPIDDAAGNPDARDEGDGGTSDGAAEKGAWGEPCTVGNDATCATGLFCLQGPSGGSVGFCTKTCPATSSTQCSGTPQGTAAFCVVTDVDNQGDKGCAFACRIGAQTWPCPGELKCETADDPPDSGQRLCLP